MKITKELTDRFLLGLCSPDEVNAIVTALSDNPAMEDDFFSKKEWDDIEPAPASKDAVSARILKKLKEELFNKEKAAVTGHFTWHINRFAVAAAIISIAVAIYWLMLPVNNHGASIASANKINQISITAVQQQRLQTKINTGNKPMVLKLEEGSSITLYTNTIVTYQQPFASNTREITLSGDAFFEVAKNKLKPFIVTSGNLSTTALGTSFRITAFKQIHEKIRVKLFTGKVLIKSTKQIPGWKQDVFLFPGEEMNYDRQTLSVRVSLHKDTNQLRVNALGQLSIHPAGAEVLFNSTPLEQVFNQLATMQHTTIHFNSADIQFMNFTGTINSADDAATILKLIARMNGLRVLQEGAEFTIEKITKQ